MPPSIDVHLLPTLVSPDQLRGGVAVVIDVLRASTTIAHALAAGASEMLPCAEVDEARAAARQLGSTALLGGERGGVRIDGFDLGNSPAEYQPDTVRGRPIVFTTTNGTLAMQRCRQAKRVLIGAFVNMSAVVAQLDAEEAIHLLCAGTAGQVTREDVLLAGMLAVDLSSRLDGLAEWNDEAQLAADSWRQASDEVLDGLPLAQILAATRGGRNLQQIGMAADIAAAARIDALDVVPELNTLAWRIRPA